MQSRLRISILSVFLGVVACFFPASVLAAEQITHFDSHLEVQSDTSLRITETIDYTTTQSKHGIYRYIPTRYTRNNINETAKISDITVTDGQKQPIPFERSWDSGNVTLKIGDPDKTFSGDKTYIISYTVENAVGWVPDPDAASGERETQIPELYWDITGEGWQVTIASASATLSSPYASIKQTTCYAGAFGSDNQGCTYRILSEGETVFTYDQPISYGDNMTIVAQFDPEGGIVFPSYWERLGKQLRDNLVFLPLFLPAIVMVGWWWLRGRDDEFLSWNVFNQDADKPAHKPSIWSRRQVPFVYEPLVDLTPGEAGALLDEKVDNQDVISEIIDLARQKFLKIEREEKKKLFGKSTDYIFTRLKKSPKKLPEHQQYLLDNLFSKKETVKLSELKGDFYLHFEKVKQLIFTSLTKKQCFKNNPNTTRALGFTGAILLSVAAGGWMLNLLNLGLYLALLIFPLSTGVSLVVAYFLPAKTAVGRNYMWQAKGLQRMIKAGAWRQKINEKHLFFEEVLPFAIALGVVDRLSRDMEKLNIQAPDYLPVGTARAFTTSHFINSFTSQATSTLAYNPSSSSRGSGSGFSGGFSGGGGGGGGGGSW